VERYLDKFDPLSMVTPRGVFCVNKGETDPNGVNLKQNKTSSLAIRQGNKYTQKKKPCRSVVFCTSKSKCVIVSPFSLVLCWNLKHCCDVCVGLILGGFHVI
jgi:hypothetical protein